MLSRRIFTLGAIGGSMLVAARPALAAYRSPNTDFLRDGTFGIFPEFLSGDNGDDTPESWRDKVAAFDVTGFAGDVQASGAGYVFFAFGQSGGFYSSPNAAWDSLLAAASQPSRSPNRDLFGEVAQALLDIGIPTVAYMATDPSLRDTPEGQAAIGLDTDGYFDNLNAIVAEWSGNYGGPIRGWWFDGLYGRLSPAQIQALIAAARTGNADSVIALNQFGYAENGPAFSNTGNGEDFTGGESQDLVSPPGDRWSDDLQWHGITWLGTDGYGSAGSRYSVEQLTSYLGTLRSVGAAQTFDVAINGQGRLSGDQIDVLGAVRAGL